MPLYEYACTECRHHFDVRHSADEKPELACPQCEGSVQKVFHAAGIIFKGSGWYVTDSAPKNGNGAEKKVEKEEKKESSTPAATESSTPAATESKTATTST